MNWHIVGCAVAKGTWIVRTALLLVTAFLCMIAVIAIAVLEES